MARLQPVMAQAFQRRLRRFGRPRLCSGIPVLQRLCQPAARQRGSRGYADARLHVHAVAARLHVHAYHNADAYSDADTHAHSVAHAHANLHAYGNADAYSDGDANAHAHNHAHAYDNADAHNHGYAHADGNGNAHCDGNAHQRDLVGDSHRRARNRRPYVRLR